MLLLLASLPAIAQTDDMQRLFSYFKAAAGFDHRYPREKVYLHLDNNAYFEDETLWFKAYVVRASSLQPTTLSRVLYVELLKDDGQLNALTLRLRELGGLIRAAGDMAVMEDSEFITADHIRRAIRRSRPAEDQIKERYGSYTKGLSKDISSAQKEKSQYYLQNETVADDRMFN